MFLVNRTLKRIFAVFCALMFVVNANGVMRSSSCPIPKIMDSEDSSLSRGVPSNSDMKGLSESEDERIVIVDKNGIIWEIKKKGEGCVCRTIEYDPNFTFWSLPQVKPGLKDRCIFWIKKVLLRLCHLLQKKC